MEGQVPVAEVIRGGWVESVHAGHAVIVDPDGSVVRSWGRPEDPVLLRSAAKPLLGAGMLGAGLDLDGEHLAIAVSSHNGEPIHVRAVREVLAGGGLTEDDLANPPWLPFTTEAKIAWIRAGRGPSRITQNCSGKHAAMLRTAQALGAPTAGYMAVDHPVQAVVIAAVERLSGEAIAALATDGCGVPVVAISLVGLARAYSRMVTAPAGTPEGRVAYAMAAHPMHVGGTGRDTTAFMTAWPRAIAKDGSEGVHVLALPDGRAAALKVADGSERARAAVAVGLMGHLGVPAEVIAVSGPEPVLGGGQPVGSIECLI